MSTYGAVWLHKGLYGNGTPFAPFMDLYECSNCKALSVEQFEECPECQLPMKTEGGEKNEYVRT